MDVSFRRGANIQPTMKGCQDDRRRALKYRTPKYRGCMPVQQESVKVIHCLLPAVKANGEFKVPILLGFSVASDIIITPFLLPLAPLASGTPSSPDLSQIPPVVQSSVPSAVSSSLQPLKSGGWRALGLGPLTASLCSHLLKDLI